MMVVEVGDDGSYREAFRLGRNDDGVEHGERTRVSMNKIIKKRHLTGKEMVSATPAFTKQFKPSSVSRALFSQTAV